MLYRFRETKRLLEDKELEDQYFYFTSPDQQNDPMEGYLECFWKGDDIAWKGLLKNYIWQLFRARMTCACNVKLAQIQNLFFERSSSFSDNDNMSMLRVQLENEFVDDEQIDRIVHQITSLKRELLSEELILVLTIIHPIAVKKVEVLLQCSMELSDEGLICQLCEEEIKRKENLINDIGLIFSNVVNPSMHQEQLRVYANSILIQGFLKTAIQGNGNNQDLFRFLWSDFPRCYVEAMPRLTFPNWYCVCFNNNISSPALWGYYADRHYGACLMFDYQKDQDVRLRSLAREQPKFLEIGRVEQVLYGINPPKVNFFLTLGELWEDEREHWLIHHGKQSKILDVLRDNIEMYRNMMDATNMKRFLRKSTAWKQENEYRVVLSDYWDNHQEDRKYQYDFTDLKGIIFGIRTPLARKREIIDIILQKCKEHHRKDFQFYQAVYNSQTDTIETYPIILGDLLIK